MDPYQTPPDPRWNLVPRPTSAPGWNPGVPGPQAQNQKNKTP